MKRKPSAKSARSATVDALAITIDAAIEAIDHQQLEALDRPDGSFQIPVRSKGPTPIRGRYPASIDATIEKSGEADVH